MKIFSGDNSVEMWSEINKAKTVTDLRRALYGVCCKLQELESKVKMKKKKVDKKNYILITAVVAKANEPTLNGRIFSEECLKKMVDDKIYFYDTKKKQLITEIRFPPIHE